MEFLEDLYHNGIIPYEKINRPKDAEYQELEEQYSALKKQICESLSAEQMDLLEKLIELKLSIHMHELGAAYAEGFRLGGRFIAEIHKDII